MHKHFLVALFVTLAAVAVSIFSVHGSGRKTVSLTPTRTIIARVPKPSSGVPR